MVERRRVGLTENGCYLTTMRCDALTTRGSVSQGKRYQQNTPLSSCSQGYGYAFQFSNRSSRYLEKSLSVRNADGDLRLSDPVAWLLRDNFMFPLITKGPSTLTMSVSVLAGFTALSVPAGNRRKTGSQNGPAL
jgi:hypothetical protein